MPYTFEYRRIPSGVRANNGSIPVFEGSTNINLGYILKNHPANLPARIRKQVEYIVSKKSPCDFPTLYDLHLKTYKPLLECETLEEAQKLFPEFEDVKDISKLKNKRMKFLSHLNVKPENLSLNMLKDYFGKLKNQEELIVEYGFPSKSAILSVNKKIKFPVFPNNYRTLLTSSTDEGKRIRAEKTIAYNKLHREWMLAHNRAAAQRTKTPEYRAAQSLRIKEYDKVHPERKEKIGRFTSEVWKKFPHVKAAMKLELDENPMNKGIAKKIKCKIPLTEDEKRINKAFYRNFWRKYPQYQYDYKKACQEVSASRNLPKNIGSE